MSDPIPTIAEARFILSHVYCVHHLPHEDGIEGFARPWFNGLGEGLCARCSCREPRDLRIWIASPHAAARYITDLKRAIAKHEDLDA